MNIQNAPELPDPVGLRAAFQLLAKNDLFKDVTGLEGNQRNALSSFQGALETAKFFGGKASELAQQNEAARSVDRQLAQIEQARDGDLISQTEAQDLAHAALSSLVGEPKTAAGPPTDEPAVSRAIDAAVQSERGQVTVTTPSGSVDAAFEGGAKPALGSGLRPVVSNLVKQVARPVVFEKLEAFDDAATIPGKTLRRFRMSTTVTASRDVKLVTAVKVPKSSGGDGPINLVDAGFAPRDPANPGLFTVPLKMRVVHPEDPARPGVMAGTGRLPVVVLVHGSHIAYFLDERVTPAVPKEIPNHEGYAYLQAELALRGIVSVSINTNLASALACMADERANLILETLAALRILDGQKGVYQGRLDLGNVGLMGHSRAGEAVALAAQKNLLLAEDQRFGIRAVCSLAPSDYRGMSGNSIDLKPENTGFYLVLYGSQDGDVTGLEPLVDKASPGAVAGIAAGSSAWGTGFRLYDRASCPKAMVFARNFSHNRFNTVWSVEATGGPNSPHPGNGDESGIDPIEAAGIRSHKDHRDLAVKLIGGLFRWKLLNETALAGLFNGATALGFEAALQWSFGNAVTALDDFEAAANNLGGTRTISIGSRVAFARQATGPKPFFDLVPHQTTALVADLTAAPPANVSVVEAVGAPGDWSGFDRITFRIGANYNVAQDLGPQPLPRSAIRLTDADGHSARVEDAKYLALPTRPYPHTAGHQGPRHAQRDLSPDGDAQRAPRPVRRNRSQEDPRAGRRDRSGERHLGFLRHDRSSSSCEEN